jgi:hypothetical protein
MDVPCRLFVIHVGLGVGRTSIHFRFATKATKLLRRHEVTRCDRNGLMHCSKQRFLFDHFVDPATR